MRQIFKIQFLFLFAGLIASFALGAAEIRQRPSNGWEYYQDSLDCSLEMWHELLPANWQPVQP